MPKPLLKPGTIIDTRLNLTEILKMRYEKGLTYEEISKLVSAPKSTVRDALRPMAHLLENAGLLQAYRDNRTSIYDAAELTFLTEATAPDKLKNASTNNLMYAFQQAHNARRLSENQSTSNVSVLSMAQSIQDEISKLATEVRTTGLSLADIETYEVDDADDDATT